MDNENIWAIYFAGVAAFKFHPRNEHEKDRITTAAKIADEMLIEHRRRFPWDG